MIPEWLPAEIWNDWLEDRKERKIPMTSRAIKIAIRKLGEYREQGHDPTTVIEYCIEKGYRGLFPPPQGVATASNSWQRDDAALLAKANAMGLIPRPGEGYRELRQRVAAALQ